MVPVLSITSSLMHLAALPNCVLVIDAGAVSVEGFLFHHLKIYTPLCSQLGPKEAHKETTTNLIKETTIIISKTHIHISLCNSRAGPGSTWASSPGLAPGYSQALILETGKESEAHP